MRGGSAGTETLSHEIRQAVWAVNRASRRVIRTAMRKPAVSLVEEPLLFLKPRPHSLRRNQQKGATAMGKRIAVLTMAAIAMAVAGYGGDRYDRRDRGRQSGIYGRNYDPIGLALRDVQNVWSRSRVDGHERDHFRKAIDSLQRFQNDAARGRFDRGQLDRAIDNLGDLAQADQIHPQGRQLLRQRLYDLRSLREDSRR